MAANQSGEKRGDRPRGHGRGTATDLDVPILVGGGIVVIDRDVPQEGQPIIITPGDRDGRAEGNGLKGKSGCGRGKGRDGGGPDQVHGVPRPVIRVNAILEIIVARGTGHLTRHAVDKSAGWSLVTEQEYIQSVSVVIPIEGGDGPDLAGGRGGRGSRIGRSIGHRTRRAVRGGLGDGAGWRVGRGNGRGGSRGRSGGRGRCP